MFRKRNIIGLALLLITLVAGYRVFVAPTDDSASAQEVLRFDVAEDASRFVFDEAPVFDDGMPKHGNAFITRGYIYPEGTLTDSSGVLENGEPEFPDQVIGEWTCRGWFIGDGAHTESGAWVMTTQVYNFSDEVGGETLVTDGYELADQNQVVHRAITGGTGPYATARGEAMQSLLGFNESGGVKLTFDMQIEGISAQ